MSGDPGIPRLQAGEDVKSYAQTDAALTAMKKTPELEWLNEVSSDRKSVV